MQMIKKYVIGWEKGWYDENEDFSINSVAPKLYNSKNEAELELAKIRKKNPGYVDEFWLGVSVNEFIIED